METTLASPTVHKIRRKVILNMTVEFLTQLLFKGTTWEGAEINNIEYDAYRNNIKFFVRDDDNPAIPQCAEGAEVCHQAPRMRNEMRLVDVLPQWLPDERTNEQAPYVPSYTDVYAEPLEDQIVPLQDNTEANAVEPGPAGTTVISVGTITIPAGASLNLPPGSSVVGCTITGMTGSMTDLFGVH